MNEARIKLAEAMELWIGDVHADGESVARDAHKWDPFTDANDDYAVLEWMRKFRNQIMDDYPDGGFPIWTKFAQEINRTFTGSVVGYQIGDYARAACKVLDID